MIMLSTLILPRSAFLFLESRRLFRQARHRYGRRQRRENRPDSGQRAEFRVSSQITISINSAVLANVVLGREVVTVGSLKEMLKVSRFPRKFYSYRATYDTLLNQLLE